MPTISLDMGFWVRVVLGSLGLALFAGLAARDARALRDERAIPPTWTLLAVGGTVVAGFVHVALTADHWRTSPVYGTFFIAAGLLQLFLASVLARPTTSARIWGAAAALFVNLALAGVYVQARLAAALGVGRPEPVDATGVVTVVAELVAATGCLLMTRRRRSRSDVAPP